MRALVLAVLAMGVAGAARAESTPRQDALVRSYFAICAAPCACGESQAIKKALEGPGSRQFEGSSGTIPGPGLTRNVRE